MAYRFRTNILTLSGVDVTAINNSLYLNGTQVQGGVSNAITGIKVTGSNSVTGLLNFQGIFGTNVILSGDNIIGISGGGGGGQQDLSAYATVVNLGQTGSDLNNRIIGLSGKLDLTGSNLYNFGFDNATNLSGNLQSTGSTLNDRINTTNTNVQSNATNLSGNLATTGTTLNDRISNLTTNLSSNSTNLSGNLALTGSNLNDKIVSLSGYSNDNFYLKTNPAQFINTGSADLRYLSTGASGDFYRSNNPSNYVTASIINGLSTSGNVENTGNAIIGLLENYYLKSNPTNFAKSGEFISGVSITGGLAIQGALNINAGANITLTQAGLNTFSIASTATGPGGGLDGVTGISITGSDSITGLLSINAGANITLTQAGSNSFSIASTATGPGGGGGITGISISGGSSLTGLFSIIPGQNISFTQLDNTGILISSNLVVLTSGNQNVTGVKSFVNTGIFAFTTGRNLIPDNTALFIMGADGNPTRFVLDTYNESSDFGTSIRARRARGTSALPSGIKMNDVLLQIAADGYNSGTFINQAASINILACSDWATGVNATNCTYITFKTTDRFITGTTGNVERLRISNNGFIGVGNYNPQYTLDVSGSGNFTQGVYIKNSPVPTGRGTFSYVPIFSFDRTGLINSNIISSGILLAVNDQPNPNHELLLSGELRIKKFNDFDLLVVSGDNYYYGQINVKNINTGVSGSSDLVATASWGTESDGYVNLGVNSQGHRITGFGFVGSTGDGYCLSTANQFFIGNSSPGKNLYLYAGQNPTGEQNTMVKITPTQVGISGDVYNPSGRLISINEANLRYSTNIFSKGTCFYNPDGIPTGSYVLPIWRAQFPCTITGIHGYRISGAGATINAHKNWTDLLISDLSLPATGQWYSSGIITNASVNIGDTIDAEIYTAVSFPVSITIQIDFTKS